MKEIDYKTGKFPFGPPMMCPTCKTKLQSKYRGEFVRCPCGNAVDQTGHYSRYLGEIVHYEEQIEFLLEDEKGELDE